MSLSFNLQNYFLPYDDISLLLGAFPNSAISPEKEAPPASSTEFIIQSLSHPFSLLKGRGNALQTSKTSHFIQEKNCERGSSWTVTLFCDLTTQSFTACTSFSIQNWPNSLSHRFKVDFGPHWRDGVDSCCRFVWDQVSVEAMRVQYSMSCSRRDEMSFVIRCVIQLED